MTRKSILRHILIGLMLGCLTAAAAFAQTTVFTYQGKLTDTGTPQSTYQMRFELYDAVTGGNQVGATLTNPSVAVMLGVFTLQLDFGATAFDGRDRFLEIAVRKTSNANWTVLAARQLISAAPYSIKSINSTTADSLSAVCVGCVQDANITDLSGSKVIGEIPAQSVPTGSGNYIQNAAAALRLGKNAIQQAAGFNIDGNGIIGDSLGIGTTPRSGIKLDVIGNVLITQANGVMQFGTPNSETGMSNIVGSGRADLRFDGTTLKLVVGLVGGPPPLTNGIVIDTSGNVSIGNVAFTQGKLNVTAFGSQYAVFGISNDSVGVFGRSVNNYGVYGESSGGGINSYAGFFNGRTHVGNLEVQALGTGGATAVCYNSLKLLATCSSSLRYKKNIQPFGDGLSFINQLNPIAYKWKADNMPDTGFSAEEVAKINPLFVTYNDQGEVEGVKYDRLSVVFVNAFNQQQTQIGEQKKLLAEQQIQIENLKKLLCLDHPKADFCQEK